MRRYTLVMSPEIESFVRHLHPETRGKIRLGLEAVQADPFAGKPLKGMLAGLYRYATARYRIVYEIQETILKVQVIDIDHRKVIYGKLTAR